jgi:predicted nucleic acid-binding protein
MIVADCTVIARLIIRADDPGAVDTLLELDPQWTAPLLWQAEFASVLRKYERTGRLSAEGSHAFARRALELFAHSTQQISLDRILETARRTGCSTYDSHYLALAEDLDLKLYTYDEEIITKCAPRAQRPG